MANLGYIQLARCCNQNCLFCSNPPNGRILDFDQARAYVDEFVENGYQGIILTGGEPTLFKPLAELITYARERDMPSRIITNGQKTCNFEYLKALVGAGLSQMHLSIYSVRDEVHDRLTTVSGSLENVRKSLDNAAKLELNVDVNTVICKANCNHLHENVETITTRWPMVHHFVWNNMDPAMNDTPESRKEIAQLSQFEVSLHRAMSFLEKTGRTFRVERVPLCYMTEFAYASTETRKIVKSEERTVHFLDDKDTVRQTDFFHDKTDICKHCKLNEICAGVYELHTYLDPNELYPVYVDPEPIRKKILGLL